MLGAGSLFISLSYLTLNFKKHQHLSRDYILSYFFIVKRPKLILKAKKNICSLLS